MNHKTTTQRWQPAVVGDKTRYTIPRDPLRWSWTLNLIAAQRDEEFQCSADKTMVGWRWKGRSIDRSISRERERGKSFRNCIITYTTIVWYWHPPWESRNWLENIGPGGSVILCSIREQQYQQHYQQQQQYQTQNGIKTDRVTSRWSTATLSTQAEVSRKNYSTRETKQY